MGLIYIIINRIFNLLPVLDINGYINNLFINTDINTYLGYLNYFIPFSDIKAILVLWSNIVIAYFGVKFLYKHIVPLLTKLSFLI